MGSLLEAAAGVAAVACREVAVVALLVASDDAVAAATDFHEPVRADGGRTGDTGDVVDGRRRSPRRTEQRDGLGRAESVS